MTDEAPQTCPGNFRYGVARRDDWRNALADILVQLGPVEAQHRLGIVYLTEHFQKNLAEIEVFLRQTTGVPHWVGAVGYGICAGRTEIFAEPGIAVLLMPVPEEAFRVFSVKSGCGNCIQDVIDGHRDWIEAAMLQEFRDSILSVVDILENASRRIRESIKTCNIIIGRIT